MNKHVKTNNLDSDSDHDLILATLKIKGIVCNEMITRRREYSRFNESDYITDLLGQRWTDVYDIMESTLIDSHCEFVDR